MAQAILAESGCFEPLGKQWVNRFLHRHKNVRVKSTAPLDQDRRRGSTREAYEDFFRRLGHHIEVKDVPPKYIANVDEHGMGEGETANYAKVIGDSLTSKSYRESSSATTWVSVIEAVTAGCQRLTPVIVYTGASLQGQWFPNCFENDPIIRHWKYDYSPTGFSNEGIALKWLREVYIPETKPENPLQWRILILDGASSHTTEEFMLTAFRNKVQLVYLPSHTSHKTQPLDRSVFSPLKTYFRQETALLTAFTASAPANKRRFLLAYRDASIHGITARNIRSGFKKTGIWPFDPSQILEDPQALVGDSPPPPERSPTPTNLPISESIALETPKKSLEIRKHLRNALEYQSPSSRDVRGLLLKTGKALDQANAEKAILKAENTRLLEELGAGQPKSKKRVREPANDKFASLAAIAEAQKASLKPPAPKRGRKTVNPAQVVEERTEEVIHVVERLREAEEME